MPNEIPLPPDLNYLIEKREEKEDRRESDRRQVQNDQTPEPVVPDETAEAESNSDRRADEDNRQRARRDGDESK